MGNREGGRSRKGGFSQSLTSCAFFARKSVGFGDKSAIARIHKFHFPRFTTNTSVVLPRPLTPLHSPVLARPRPLLARSSPGPRPASPLSTMEGTRNKVHEAPFLGQFHKSCKFRRRTNVQQLTCKIDLPFSFYYLFFSFDLLELKPLVLKGKVLGEKL